jgi:hypothetical protein
MRGPSKQKDRKGESDTSGGKNQRLEPAKLPCVNFVEAGTDARQERSRHFGIGGDLKTGIDGGKQGSFLLECDAAISAPGEVRTQVTWRLGAAGCGFD